MARHPNSPRLQECGVGIVYILAETNQEEVMLDIFVDRGGANTIVDAMKRNLDDARLQQRLCDTLANLAGSSRRSYQQKGLIQKSYGLLPGGGVDWCSSKGATDVIGIVAYHDP